MMELFFNFLGEHPILATFVLCTVYYTIKHITFVLPNRFLRHLNIRKCGWPPIHLDADGDFKEER